MKWQRWTGVGLAWLVLLLAADVRAERALRLTGSGAMVLPATNRLEFGTNSAFAFECWFKPGTNAADWGAIIAGNTFRELTSGEGSGSGWGVFAKPGLLSAAYRGRGLSGAFATPVPLTPGVLHHIVLNFPKVGKGSIYVDGVLKSDLFLPAGFSLDATNALQIGSCPGGTNPVFGVIDEVRIWRRVRSSSEVKQAFDSKASLAGDDEGLVAYFRMNEVAGNPRSLGELAGAEGTLVNLGNGGLFDDPDIDFVASAPQASDYALSLTGVNDSIVTQIDTNLLSGDELTIEYWFKGPRLQSAVRLQNGDTAYIVAGWQTSGDSPIENLVKTGPGTYNSYISLGPPHGVQDGRWHHLAMVYQRNRVKGLRSYLDGVDLDYSSFNTTGPEKLPVIANKLWIGSYNGTGEFLQGQIDEVRIWNRALTASNLLENARNPRRLYGSEPGLVAYLPFNVSDANGTREEVSGKTAFYSRASAASMVPLNGITFAEPARVVVPNPAAAGLWLGEVSLTRVSDVGLNTNRTLPSGGAFDFNVVMHVDTNGTVRLLRDVTIMQKRNSQTNLTELVLVTDESLLPQLDGVVKRAGKLVGVRYSSAFYQFNSQTLAMSGGLGLANAVAVTNVIPARYRTAPFFHLYHPNHKDPRDLQGVPYDVERRITLEFNSEKIGLGEGRDSLAGAYRETILGLHKLPLHTEGTVRLTRISLVNKLNGP